MSSSLWATSQSTEIPSLLTLFFGTAAAGILESTRLSSLALLTLQEMWLLMAPHILRVGKTQPLKWLLRTAQAETGTVVSPCVGHFRWLFLFTLGTFKAASLKNQCSRCLFSACLDARLFFHPDFWCQPLKRHLNGWIKRSGLCPKQIKLPMCAGIVLPKPN